VQLLPGLSHRTPLNLRPLILPLFSRVHIINIAVIIVVIAVVVVAAAAAAATA